MNKLIVSSSPHFHAKDTTAGIMLDVIIALTPAMIASVIIFGFRAAVIILTTVASCILSEYLSRVVMKRRQTVGDLSCVVTGRFQSTRSSRRSAASLRSSSSSRCSAASGRTS